MAWTARGDDDKKEYFDSPEELERKVQQLADWVRESKHFFVFTVRGEGPTWINYYFSHSCGLFLCDLLLNVEFIGCIWSISGSENSEPCSCLVHSCCVPHSLPLPFIVFAKLKSPKINFLIFIFRELVSAPQLAVSHMTCHMTC